VNPFQEKINAKIHIKGISEKANQKNKKTKQNKTKKKKKQKKKQKKKPNKKTRATLTQHDTPVVCFIVYVCLLPYI
jgi:hypothetical protein